MTAPTALASGRAAAERLMTDTCTVTRPGAVIDDVTGEAEQTEVYAGRCKVQSYQAYERTPEAGEAVLTVQRYRVDLPVPVRPEPGDLVTITASPTDPLLAGRVYRVTAPFSKTYATAARCFADEVV